MVTTLGMYPKTTKMKKLTLFPILFLLLASLAFGINMPHPIHGYFTYEGKAYSGYEVRVTNQDSRNMDSVVVKTDEKGFYQVDLPNFSPGYREGDRIKVELTHCAGAAYCYKIVEVTGGGNAVNFDFTPIEKPEPKYVCWDGSVKINANECPELPNYVFIAGISAFLALCGLVWNAVKNTELKGIFKWIPGMAGIQKKRLERYKELCKLGKNGEARKLQSTILKTSSTITKKYLDSLIERYG